MHVYCYGHMFDPLTWWPLAFFHLLCFSQAFAVLHTAPFFLEQKANSGFWLGFLFNGKKSNSAEKWIGPSVAHKQRPPYGLSASDRRRGTHETPKFARRRWQAAPAAAAVLAPSSWPLALKETSSPLQYASLPSPPPLAPPVTEPSGFSGLKLMDSI